MIFILILVYVLNSQLVVEKVGYKTEAECIKMGQARIDALEKDPKYDGNVFADCVPLSGQEVKNSYYVK